MQATKQEAALQWLLTQHHDEVSMLVCDFRVRLALFASFGLRCDWFGS
jgi:hypothetical protein